MHTTKHFTRATRRQRGLACLVAAALVLGLLPGALAVGEDPGHIHNQDGWSCTPGGLICGLTEGEGAVTPPVTDPDDPLYGLDDTPQAQPGHQHTDDCYEWICTELVRLPMDLSDQVLPQAGKSLTLNGKPIGDSVKESDLIGGTLKAEFTFDLPVGLVEFDAERALISTGAPMTGDTLTIPLPEVFTLVDPSGEAQPEPLEFQVTDVNTGKVITIGAAVWDTDNSQIVLTFNEEMADQHRWVSLSNCTLSIQVWYSGRPGPGSGGTATVEFFDKTFTIQHEDDLAGSYTLVKTVINPATGADLGANPVYSRAGNKTNYAKPTPNAITADGQIIWRITVEAKDSAQLNGMTVKDLLSSYQNGGKNDSAYQTILSVLLDGADVTDQLSDGAYTFPAGGDPITGAHVFTVTTQITPAFWYTQPGEHWSWGRKVANTAQLWSAEGQDGPARLLLNADASVRYVPRLIAKSLNSGSNNTSQTWTIRINDAGHTIQNAYIEDTLEYITLADADPIQISGKSLTGKSLTANTTQEEKDAKAPFTYTVGPLSAPMPNSPRRSSNRSKTTIPPIPPMWRAGRAWTPPGPSPLPILTGPAAAAPSRAAASPATERCSPIMWWATSVSRMPSSPSPPPRPEGWQARPPTPGTTTPPSITTARRESTLTPPSPRTAGTPI